MRRTLYLALMTIAGCSALFALALETAAERIDEKGRS